MQAHSEVLAGLRVTVMGIGLHGGGLETIRYLERNGAIVTATDLRPEEQLRPTLERLETQRVRLVVGRHERADFEGADVVVKNPAVPRSAPLLAAAPCITTDIALYLAARRRVGHAGTMIAITGTKGKSTTASACADMVDRDGRDVRLGGNITVSPLAFVEDLDGSETIVLELSSFQLGDLAFAATHNDARRRTPEAVETAPLAPGAAIVTNIMHDHQNYYDSMEAYVADKEHVFLGQSDKQLAIFPDDEWGDRFTARAPGRTLFVGDGSLSPNRDGALLLSDGTGAWHGGAGEYTFDLTRARLPGRHNAINVLAASLAAREAGVSPASIAASIENFAGVPHRMEEIGTARGVRFVNDSAATIPDATLASIAAYDEPVVLVAGGTDKEIDVAPLPRIATRAAGIHLLEGSATTRMITAMTTSAEPLHGPYSTLEAVVESAYRQAASIAADHGSAILLFSPGAASFGMFANEFARGDAFRELARRYCDSSA